MRAHLAPELFRIAVWPPSPAISIGSRCNITGEETIANAAFGRLATTHIKLDVV
ncbi:hypothetical protein [Parapedobacter indicus]|uniref:hypothetical protein n=1 Tax=Parapedobacter indicus TaxID=1477437 RepID=UPI0015A6F87C|nr:hypothetical protein [Parapedobacter indicus]